MLYVCITFAELKKLDILRGDKLLRKKLLRTVNLKSVNK